MPTTFVLIVICMAITLGLFPVWRSFKKHLDSFEGENHSVRLQAYRDAILAARISKIAMFVFAGFTVFLLVMSCFTMVGTKKVGVVTSFGQPVGTLSNGLHLKAPWQKVTELDGAIQTDNHVGKETTKIRLGNQSTADVDNSIRWRIQPGRADSLYRDYKDFDKIRDSLVTRELKAALNEVFKDYDPLASIKQAENSGNQPTLQQLGSQVAEKLSARIGEDIEVLNVIIPLIGFDGETQGRINAYQAEIASTRIADQRKLTAEKNAAANQALADSVSNDPNVLVSRCIDVLESLAKEKIALPAGFSCWPGGQAPVAVGVK